ncbi:hypothetical protein M422DRAFT_61431 [Sphaerobolus stellatus SS14]|uniref:Unplaced genomic scaffold SPHSTscaffold_131, whole genome shotgun sequence n=1 Tax=Sphaerobolus stellatus (strain SS14) TaxID=990650 RepID=A0A0C9V9K5_SPHS4|nr:hypothetical protein M422DRAFT_61431 [Sphaerobolus stellatus SS14]
MPSSLCPAATDHDHDHDQVTFKIKYTKPNPLQAQCIPPALERRDIIGVALGAEIDVRSVVIVGGDENRVTQAVKLAKRPHIIVATSGRLDDHLGSTSGFNLWNLKYLECTTYLFSATMTTKVSNPQRASLLNPVRVEYYIFIPLIEKDMHLVYLVNMLLPNSITFLQGSSTMHNAVPLHGRLSQSQRLGALGKFKSGNRNILATDVASRGLDIPSVDVVINFDIPSNSKLSRAGRTGKAITITTQYDVEILLRLDDMLGKKLSCGLDRDGDVVEAGLPRRSKTKKTR